MKRSLVHWDRMPAEFANEVDGMFNHFFGDGNPNSGKFVPAANFSETEDGYHATFDLPGMTVDQVNIELADGKLTVTGERKAEAAVEGETWHRIERRVGEFERTVSLPKSVDHDKIEASFKNGVLTINLPKRADTLPKKIEIVAEG